MSTEEWFKTHYIPWRESRINKVVSIFGKEFFNNKTMLELAAGYGYTGHYFCNLGSTVTFADGNQDHIIKIKETNPNSTVLHVDQDKEWDLKEQFDVVIHWGVLYHLDDWQRDLRTAIAHGKLIFLETEVCDSDDPTFEIKTNESGYDQAINGIGTRPSAAMVEVCINKTGANYVRYDDADLNADFHKYDWKVNNTKEWTHGQRRFWIIRNEIHST